MEPSPDIYRGKDLDEVLKLAERSSGRPPRAPPSPGSMGVSQCRVLAQVLGFKFVYYQVRQDDRLCEVILNMLPVA